MNTSTIIAVVAVVVVLAVAVLAVRPLLRRRRLQERFGPEYDRVLESHGDRTAGEHELIERERRHKQLDLHPLPPEARDRYTAQWTEVQAQFVDAPEATVAEADRLVTALMAERGYPTEGYEQQLADLSIDHASTIERYRNAHDVYQRSGDGQASTEDLRTAMVHYRALFTELLEPETAGTPAAGRRGRTLDRDRHDGSYGDGSVRAVDGSAVDGSAVDGSAVDSSAVDSSAVDSSAVDSTPVDSADRDTTDVDAGRTDSDRRRTRRHHTTR
jgi:hypothetical protein